MVLVLASSLGMRAPFRSVGRNGRLFVVVSKVRGRGRGASGGRPAFEQPDEVLREVRGVFADPRKEGRSARPLPASADEAQVGEGRNPAVVKEIALSILHLGDLHPAGV